MLLQYGEVCHAKEGVPMRGKIPQWQNKYHW